MHIVWVALRRSFIASATALSVVLGACSNTKITPITETAPPRSVTIIALGDITVGDKRWNDRIPILRNELKRKLIDYKTFQQVLDPAPASLGDSAILLTGKITDVDEGDGLLRFFVGFGEGASSGTASFQLRDRSGVELASFTVSKSYDGGAGFGGGPFVGMDGLTEGVGGQTADLVVHWVKGQRLKP